MTKKLMEVDPLVDASLVVDYLLVLLGNGNGEDRIEKELSDFLSPSLATSYSRWLFNYICNMQSKGHVSLEKTPRIEGRAFIAAVKAVEQENNGQMMDEDGKKEIFSSASRIELRSKRFGGGETSEKRENRNARIEKHSRKNDRSTRRTVRPIEQRDRRYSSRDSDRSTTINLDKRLSHVKDARELLHKGRLIEKAVFTVENDLALRRRPGNKNYATESEAKVGSMLDAKKQIKCAHWPNCKIGEECPYVHPTDPCKYFPNCSFGDKCLNIHPVIPCKFQDRCQNPNCNYQHSSPACLASSLSGSRPFAVNNNPYQPPSAITCRFFPNCKNTDCPFVHPNSSECNYGAACLRPACPFAHPPSRSLANKSLVNAPCRYGKSCSKSDCPFQHPSAATMESSMMEIDMMLPSATTPMS